MCYYRVFFMLWFILQQCWQITALQLITVRVAFPLQHNRLSDAPMWPFTLLALSIRRGVDVIRFWNRHALGQRCGRKQWEPGRWDGALRELPKDFCYVRQRLDFRGFRCFDPITLPPKHAKFIAVEVQRQQANALWHTYSSLEMNSTLWLVWDLGGSLKPFLNAVFTSCQSREDVTHIRCCVEPSDAWGK